MGPEPSARRTSGCPARGPRAPAGPGPSLAYRPGIAEYRTIPELFEETLAAVPDKTWLLFEDDAYTYAEAHGRIAAVAAGLRRHGLAMGDIVLATARNDPRYVFLWLAAAYSGVIYLGVDPRQTDTELDGLVQQTEPTLVVTDANLDELFAEQGSLDGPGPATHDDPAVLIPTSGTTGRSKLVTQTHRAYAMAGEGFPWWIGLAEDDRLMTSLPLFHINAPAYSVLGSVTARASLALLPRFSARGFLDSARRHGATQFNAIGAMLEILMRQPERPDDADTPLRLAYAGPTPPEERHLEFERRFGLELTSGYAMSETTYGTVWAHGTRPYGTLGSPRQHPRLGVVNEARVNADGELELRNPAVMKGYWGMPEETERVLAPDGWLKTGDLVTENEDGTYTFVGRRKEVIRRRGENVAPAEIEEALASHPDVVEVAVVGVPSELSEEDIKAFVVMRDGADADFDELRDWAAQRLTAFKVPSLYEALRELPHTATGRIAKHRLPT
ncbi:MAG TPA: AMP-binding protein [Thermoleophilaceae bacterium]|nr:AMP-binding protein [Thermoleophilaceae bacterium]